MMFSNSTLGNMGSNVNSNARFIFSALCAIAILVLSPVSNANVHISSTSISSNHAFSTSLITTLQAVQPPPYQSPVWCDDFTIGGEIQGYIARDGVTLGGNAFASIVLDDDSIAGPFAIQDDTPTGITPNILRYIEGPPVEFRLDDINNLILPEPEVTPLGFTRLNAASATRTTANNDRNIAPGDYARVTARSNANFTGGEYYIRELILDNNNAVYTFQSGDYYIGSFSMQNGADIRIQGDVNFHIGGSFISQNNVQLNNQAGASPQSLRIFLYENPSTTTNTLFEVNNNMIAKGVIYSLDTRTRVEIKNNSFFEGGIAINGSLRIEQNSEVRINDSPIGFTPGTSGECISYLRIEHPEEVVSCTAAPVTFTACSNDDCSITYNSSFDIRLAANPNTALWLTSPSQNPSVFRMVPPGPQTTGLTNVPGGLTQILTSYWDQDSGAWAGITGDRLQCAPNCEVNFIESGIIVSGSGADGGYNTPLSPIPAGNEFDSYLWAVRTDPLTGACQAELDNVVKPVSVAAECLNPAACAGDRDFNLAGASVPPVNSGASLVYETVNLNFTQGRALMPNNRYRDVGQYRIHAKLTIVESGVSDEEDREPSRALSGSSSPFILHPYALEAVALNADGTIHSDTSEGFVAAGEPFNMLVRSYDSLGGITPSFGRETPMPQVEFAHSLISPATGVDGVVTNPTSVSIHPLPGHMQLNGITWNEVGVVNMNPLLLNNLYLGESVTLGSASSPIGHFYPERFEVVTAASMISSSCATFVYMEQPEFELSLTVHALNQFGDITENYGIDYPDRAVLSLVAADIDPSAAPGSDPIDTLDNELSNRLLALDSGTWISPEFNEWESGVLELDLDDLKFARRDDFIVDGPFENLFVGVRVISERDDRDFDYGLLSTAEILNYRVLDIDDNIAQSVRIGDDLNSIRLRFGRLSLENIFGPETEPLPVMMRTEYWNGSRFAVNIDDSCTPHDFALLSVESDPDSLNPNNSGAPGVLTDGQLMTGEMLWLNPDATQTGIFLFEYDAPEWLQYRWDAAVDELRNPRATAEFGRFRSRDRVIYWLEQR